MNKRNYQKFMTIYPNWQPLEILVVSQADDLMRNF